MSEIRLLVTGRTRAPTRLDSDLPEPVPPDPDIATLFDALQAREDVGVVWLAGGEPTLRPDLPALVRAIDERAGEVGLISDSLAFAKAERAHAIAEAGVKRVRVTLHAARIDAHDWLVGQQGAGRLAVKALRALKAASIAAEIGAVITRPTMPHIDELIALADELAVRTVHLRMIRGRGAAAGEMVMLSPRLALLEPYLARAARASALAGVRLVLHDVPLCAARDAARCRAPHRSVRWLGATARWRQIAALLADPPHVSGCAACPGLPECAGAPADYVAHFGRDELASEDGTDVGRPNAAPADAVLPVPAPPPRAGRSPATRLHVVMNQAAGTTGDDPLAPREPSPIVDRIVVSFEDEPSRDVRLRLVKAAQEGARCLRVEASFAHPAAPALLREATLLGFERVEVAGDASALDRFSDADMYSLRGITSLEAVVSDNDPNARADAQRVVDRLADVAGVTVRVMFSPE